MSNEKPTEDPIDDPEEARQMLLATAYHEAGHAVMAQIVGRPIEKVSISPAQMQTGGMRLGVCKIQKGRSKASKDSLEDEVLILFAGMVAEARLTGHYCHSGANQDLKAIRRILANRAGNERQLVKLERRLLEKTEHILGEDAHIKAIQWIAHELIKHETISGRAVRHFLSQASNEA